VAVAKTYAERATQYARDVVAGKIPNCRWVKRACQRHLDDLARVTAKDFPFLFDEARAWAVCAFAEKMPHVKGKWAKRHELIVLQDWQCFVLCALFGWIYKKSKLRRFRKAYLKIPRKNGKSVLAAIIGLFMWCMDGEHGAEVYSGATTEKQAWEVFRPARQMLEKCPKLVKRIKAEIWAKSLVTLEDQSRFEPMIGDPGDGASPHCSISDEFHEHDTSNQVDTMETGMGAREQPLLLMITTAGTNIAGPCYDQELECRRVLLGLIEQDDLFCLMYGIDEPEGDEPGTDWTNPVALRMANPNLGISVFEDFLLAQQRSAVLNPANQNKFKTKHLNVWCSAKIAWMPMVLWGLRGDPGLSIEDFKGQPCIGVLDLASKDDIAVFAQIFRKKIKTELHYYLFAKYYLPEKRLEEPGPNQTAYNKWMRSGVLTVTDGEEIDFETIESDVLEARKKVQFKEIVYDPWRATQMVQSFKKVGATCVEFNNTVKNMSAPMKEVLAAVRGCRIHHDQNPATDWMVSNVVAKEDAKDNVYPRKEKKEMKIDGAVAIIMGVARAMVEKPGGSLEDWIKDPVAA
jgi:phage terminase large subunit-like protein